MIWDTDWLFQRTYLWIRQQKRNDAFLDVGDEDAEHILLKFSETKEWLEEIICSKWWNMKEIVASRKVLDCTNKAEVTVTGKWLFRIRGRWENEVARHSPYRRLGWIERVTKKVVIDIDIFVNCSWVNTPWQCYSTHNQYIEQHNNNRTTQITTQHNNNRKKIAQHNDNYFWRVQTVPRLVSLALAFALQLRKKHGKTSVRVVSRENI